jgi:hypothetical protein
LPVRAYNLEGEDWNGTAADLVTELRERRSQLATLPSYRAALKEELDVCLNGGDPIDDDAEEKAA